MTDYDPRKDAHDSYYVAIEAKRRRGDKHAWDDRPWKRREIIGDCVLYLGDCLEILPTLGKVDAVVTDPPYGAKLNTDSSRFTGGNCAVARRGPKRGKGSADGRPITNDHKPFDPSPLLELGQHQIIFGMNYFPHRLRRGATLVWLKKSDDAFGTFLSDAELAWMSKGTGVYCRRDFSMKAIERERAHPTQKPVSLMKWCLSFLPDGGVILDPYMGSGSTGIAAIQTGRSFIGIEIDEIYFERACERIRKAYAQPDLFVEAAKAGSPKQESLFAEDGA